MDPGGSQDGGARAVRTVIAAAITLVVTAGVSGCGGPGDRAGSTTTTGRATTVAPAGTVATTPGTTAPTGAVPAVAWTACGNDRQCGSVTVPLDYSQPRGRTIRIALERRPAGVASERIGSLVINPGGPGTSGIDDLQNELNVLTGGLLDRFDIVSFDPRGVGRSAPVECSAGPGAGAGGTRSTTPTTAPAPATVPAPLPDPVPVTTAAQVAAVAADRAYGAACQEYSDGILPFVGTVDAARDLDRIRAALGDEKLTYVGHSYGTLLGAVYAGMYPGHVRAMVLDGAIDPALGTDQMVLDQARGFESVLDDFFTWCRSSSCAWREGPDPTAALVSLIARSRTNPLPAGGGRVAGPGEFYNALLDKLYARSSWPSLGDALAEAAAGNATGLVGPSDSYASGGSTNGGDANNAINCLDHPTSTRLSTFPRLAARAASVAPVFGPLLAWGLLQCALWPVTPSRTPGPITAAGAPPILVTGTTGDPATPYPWAVALARELEHARARDLAGGEPRGLLLQSLCPGHRPGLPAVGHPAAGRDEVHRLSRPAPGHRCLADRV